MTAEWEGELDRYLQVALETAKTAGKVRDTACNLP